MIKKSVYRSILPVLFYISIVILSTFFLVPVSQAQAALATHAVSRASSAGHITIIVLDMSGSMTQNDPNGYRCSAADAYIDLSGVNDYIGIIGLDNNNGSRTDSHNFLTAQEWTQPVNTATVAQRQQLRDVIKNKSNSCRPDSTTPTYEALSQALTMLNTATQGKQLSGSVILLTDGVPDPDTTDQISAIQSELVPQFKQHNWPVDAIALGQDGPIAGGTGTFHDFLSGISDATAGKFYDDTKGPVAGVSPLNIAPFFDEIFATRAGRTLNHDIPPTDLAGGALQRNFTVTDATSNLDVVVINQNQDATVSLVTPDGQRITTAGSTGALVSPDPYSHYFIFSINQPLAGQWEVDVSGTGQFMLDSLKLTDLHVAINSVAMKDINLPATNSLPLGQAFEVTASLSSSNHAISDNTFQISGTVTYAGSSGAYSQTFTLTNNAGTYVGDLTVPTTAPAGSYSITVNVATVSAADVIASDHKSVRIELFPQPLFLDTKTARPANTSASVPLAETVIQWDPFLQFFYSLPVLNGLNGWPLQGNQAQQSVNLPGEVQLNNNVYPDAQVSAQAYAGNTQKPIPVNVTQDNGTFQAKFVAPASSTYKLVFLTSGSFKDSHGDFGPTLQYVEVTLKPPTAAQRLQAYVITLIYVLLFAFIILLFRFFLLPRPYGRWQRVQGGEAADGRKFSRAHRNPIQWFFSRNQLYSRQAGMPRGLRFRFRWGGGIDVRPEGPGRQDWQLGDGSSLRAEFQPVRELVFHPRGSDDPNGEDVSSYTVLAQEKAKSTATGAYDDDFGYTQPAKASKRRSAKPAYDNDDFDYAPSPKRGKKQSRRGKSSSYDDDYFS